jgi:hypothetical protein
MSKNALKLKQKLTDLSREDRQEISAFCSICMSRNADKMRATSGLLSWSGAVEMPIRVAQSQDRQKRCWQISGGGAAVTPVPA